MGISKKVFLNVRFWSNLSRALFALTITITVNVLHCSEETICQPVFYVAATPQLKYFMWKAICLMHYLKSLQIRSFFWSVFSFIWTEYGLEKTPYLDTFHVVMVFNHRSQFHL